MKLRIHGNSIRLRLSRSEVAHFKEQGFIAAELDFGAMGKFTYSLATTNDFTFHCKYDVSGIAVKVPAQFVSEWADSDRAEMSGEQQLDSGASVQLLVEKDFQCLHKDPAVEEDAFPNPLDTRSGVTST